MIVGPTTVYNAIWHNGVNVLATVPNKDGQDQFSADVHVYRPSEIISAKVNTAIKPPAGAAAAGKPAQAPA